MENQSQQQEPIVATKKGRGRKLPEGQLTKAQLIDQFKQACPSDLKACELCMGYHDPQLFQQLVYYKHCTPCRGDQNEKKKITNKTAKERRQTQKESAPVLCQKCSLECFGVCKTE